MWGKKIKQKLAENSNYQPENTFTNDNVSTFILFCIVFFQKYVAFQQLVFYIRLMTVGQVHFCLRVTNTTDDKSVYAAYMF